ncbi:MAG: uroporphyrinogen-III C-methyltransferase [Acidobacteriota bacterium]
MSSDRGLRPAPLTPTPPRLGQVFLVGAGPGDPDLITVRGLRCLQRADAVLYDRLLHPALLDEVPDCALRLFVGKAPGRPGIGQAGIHRLLIEHARRGLCVVRLKGGDPFVFGRGSEEAEALTAAGIPWEVVPAVSSAVGVPARAGIPLTHRKLARSFAVVTAHRAGEQADDEPNWQALAGVDTLVVLMGVAALPTVVNRLIAAGTDPKTPAAIIARGTLPDAHVVTSPLAELPTQAAVALIRSPATIVIGRVVGLRERLIDLVSQPEVTALTDAETPNQIANDSRFSASLSDLPVANWEHEPRPAGHRAFPSKGA